MKNTTKYSVWLNIIQHIWEYNTNNINQFEYDRLDNVTKPSANSDESCHIFCGNIYHKYTL